MEVSQIRDITLVLLLLKTSSVWIWDSTATVAVCTNILTKKFFFFKSVKVSTSPKFNLCTCTHTWQHACTLTQTHTSVFALRRISAVTGIPQVFASQKHFIFFVPKKVQSENDSMMAPFFLQNAHTNTHKDSRTETSLSDWWMWAAPSPPLSERCCLLWLPPVPAMPNRIHVYVKILASYYVQ